MRKKNKVEVERILNKEAILYKDRVLSDVALDCKPRKSTLLHTASRLLLYSRTPMGLQLTVARYKEVEHITSGKKKGKHYVQLLGEGSRVLLLFDSKSSRETYKDLCAAIIENNRIQGTED
ncbi:MAG: hypothetical protein F4065_00485 [Rhodothermaceae bacterium]|nr:hypothetical protein [Rhodothermaceae bacterium]MXZ58641.1 hypothetical protein [Rhodothermaceae bacterium]MYB90997.1 hypothetical protein [Rhodothermaceae bacterium]MYD66954.1 hypothetical protein [Rhodothermaceae bacterium]MYG44792.1 hypothetical protein [Rhodothermaceae bacterium]